jgi:prepilin-type N-terminal cleavage/methylation domain-containing protein
LLKRPVDRARTQSEAGVSLVELLIVVAVIAVVTKIGVFTVTAVLPTLRADSALEQMLTQLRQARTRAVNQRRNLTVTFRGTNELVVVLQQVPTGTQQIADIVFPLGMVYTVVAGVPDTPDGFGNTQALNFNCPVSGDCSLVFQSDGTVLANGTLVNGTVFLGVPGKAKTARAVTVLGATGRMRSYRCNGAAWF